MTKYFDRNGKEIKAGDRLKHIFTEEVELVISCGDDDLGFNASNPDYLANNPYVWPECYPLSDFDLRDWEIL